MSFKHKRHSLKWRLIISFFLLVIIPTSTIGLFSYNSSYKAIEKKMSVYSYQVMLQTIKNLDLILGNVQDISLQIISTRSVQKLLKEAEIKEPENFIEVSNSLNNLLKNTISSRQEIIGVNILMKNIDHVFVCGEPLVDIGEYKQNTIYTRAIEKDSELVWTGTYENPNSIATYTNIATLSRKIIDVTTGEELGVLVLGVKEFALADTFSYLDLGPNGFTFVVDEKGKVISDLNKRNLSTYSKHPFIYDIVENKNDISAFPEYVDHEKVLVTYSKSQRTGWYMVGVVPYHYLTQEIESIGKLTQRLTLIFLVISLGIGLLISYSVFRPIKRLEEDMQKVKNGDLTIRSNITGENEVAKLALGFNSMIEQIDVLIKKNYESQLMKQEAQISALQSQINPHFLYNTLAVIDGMALKNGQTDIAEVSQVLGDIFRYSTGGNELATIEEELIQTGKYLQIYKFRKGHKLTFDIHIDPEVKDYLLPKLLIQPLVENAIIHGIDEKRDGGHIRIEAKGYKDKIKLNINDDGIGMDEEALNTLREKVIKEENLRTYWHNKGEHHIGLANVNNRIKNHYGEAYGLQINSKKTLGTFIEITIPRQDRNNA